jgi:hypothetical protein
MKTRIIFLLIGIISLLILSCDKKGKDNFTAPCGKIVDFHACGVDDIGNNLKWLNDIIVTSKTDKTGNYLGNIWYKKYNNQDFIVTNMMLGSGGLMYHTFNCSGESSPVDDISFYNSLSENDILYTSICID